jgi:nucleolar protein 53
VLSHPRDAIAVPAITEPHQGTSYNPPAEAHRELLLQAHEKEERRIREAEKLAEVKEKIESARREVEEVNPAVAPGMKVDEIVHDEADLDEDSEEIPGKKPPPRKTQSQRKKAARLLAEVCLVNLIIDAIQPLFLAETCTG